MLLPINGDTINLGALAFIGSVVKDRGQTLAFGEAAGLASGGGDVGGVTLRQAPGLVATSS